MNLRAQTDTDLLDPPAQARKPLLDIRNLRIEYHTMRGHLTAIPDFSLTLHEGESLGVVGESGCGKSTLALAIMRYLGTAGVIANGEILFEGQDLVRADAPTLQRIRGTRISMVYQEPASALNPSMTIGRQLIEGPMLQQNLSHQQAWSRARDTLREVHIPDPDAFLRSYPHQLSGGQKQRVVIAMALLANPALLILDEPTTGLDVTVEAAVLDLIDEIRRNHHTALLYISHNLGLIARVTERVGVMYAGELVEDAPVRHLFAAPRHPYTRGLLAAIPRAGRDKRSAALAPIGGSVPSPGRRPPGCGFAARCALALPDTCQSAPIPLLPIADNHHARCVRWQETFATPEPDLPTAGDTAADSVLQAESLSRFYRMRHGTVRALDAMDLEAHRGEVLAVVGESGSGKSTFARVLAGLDTASGGALRFNGEDIANRPVDRRRAEQVAAIQMVFQNPDGTLNPSFSAGWPIARALRKFRFGRRRTEIESRVNELLRLVRLPPSVRHALPRQLSGGQKQRVAIARAFAGRPDLLIADEPTSALDVSVQAAVVNLLLRIQAENQATMLFISHDLGLVRYIADNVVVLYLGQVMECGPTQALYAPPFHPYTEALLSAMPSVDPAEERDRIVLSGELPSRFNPPKGCRFSTRCPRKVGEICDRETPPMRHTTEGHMIFCHIPLADLRAAQSPEPTALPSSPRKRGPSGLTNPTGDTRD